ACRLMWMLVVPVLALLLVLSTLQYQERIADAERELLRRADERAQELDALARPAIAHVHDLRRLLEERWDDPPDSGPALRDALTPLLASDGSVDGWSLDGAPESARQRFGQVWWAPADGREPDQVWLRRAQSFIEVARVVQHRSPGFHATWFAAADANTSFGYPWVASAQMLAAMGLPSLRALDGPRQAGVQRAKADLAGDPNDTTFWGTPYLSQLDGELVISHGAFVVVGGRYRGEVSVDFKVDELQRAAQRWQESGEQVDTGTRVWIADRHLNVLADASQPLQSLLPRPPARHAGTMADHGDKLKVPLVSRLPPGMRAADLDATLFSAYRVQRVSGWVVAAAVRIGSPWVYVQATPLATLRAEVLPTLLPNALLGLALLGIYLVGQWVVGRWVVDPALRVLAYLHALSSNPAAVPPRLSPRWSVWVDAVTNTFARQRELQRRERSHEAFKSAMVDHAPTAIVTAGGEGHIVDFNPAAERLFGRSRDSVLGQVMGNVLLPERHREAHRAEMVRLRAGEPVEGFGEPFEMKGQRADGSEFPMQMLAFHIQIEGEHFYTAFITDLSARQEAALQIERQRDALRQTEKLSAMGTLLAGVAHELNNPLAIVMGRASLLEEKAAESPQGSVSGGQLAADARRIREAAERCGRIVRTFLNMARHKPAERSAVQLNDIARAAADMLGYTLRSHGITIDLQLADTLPEVQADGDQLGQVVLNLIVNAQQALAAVQGPRRISVASGIELARDSEGGEPSPRSEGRGVLRETRIWLRVSDTGPGVPRAEADKIFEPFFTTKEAGLGTGLGLSVSRSIVREHGGDLTLEKSGYSTSGATFRLSLPISGQLGFRGPASAASPLAHAAGEAHARVLVVDDEPEIADLIRAVLEGAGFDVVTAESGAVALEMLAEARFDAIVSDVRMPDLDGAALWRAVRERWPSLTRRVLFVTGDTLSMQAREILLESGCTSLDKPFGKADLLAAVHATLER
ncbi:MAG TPA: response regulator, partial [Rubrivivax sp.]|nr:response regulator [Rubrivivax sp.]